MSNKVRKAQVVHYTKLEDRKNNIINCFSDSDMQLNFIESYDQEDLTDEILKRVYFPNKESFESKVSGLWGFGNQDENRFRILNKAELSCTIKHIEAIRLVAEGEEDIGLVLEDDAIPNTSDFLNLLDKIVESGGSEWDSIFLGTGCGLSFIAAKLNEGHERINNHLLKVQHPVTNCAEAYLLRKSSAQKLYEAIIPFNLVSDWELAYHFYNLNMNVYWGTPPLFQQGSKNGLFISTLR